ncbi:hypothetical protein B7463_g3400, partial [Scytalidium lignicola]
MRLINTMSIEVERFTGKVPPYAILSHRWQEEEVTPEDMKPGGAAKGMKGYRKLRLSCAIAVREGLKYIWIDTCCIDKASSAELSEAINSMFRYYREAVVCYVYLSDTASTIVSNIFFVPGSSDFYSSAWFTRGWTLQELIAPKNLRFYNKNWNYLGNKADFEDGIQFVTKIPQGILLGGDLTDKPRSTEKETIERPFWGLLAKSPSYFLKSPDIAAPCTMTMATSTAATLTGRGVNVEFLLAPMPNDPSDSIYVALIFVDRVNWTYGLLLQKLSYSGGQFTRVAADISLEIDSNMRIESTKLP